MRRYRLFSGTEARMLFQMDKAGFSLILLDLMLPGISGEEVLAQIRKQGNTPVIVLTAKDGLDEKNRASYQWGR